MGVAMLVYGREEQADVLIEQLLRDKVRDVVGCSQTWLSADSHSAPF
jgi:hypothetical protein